MTTMKTARHRLLLAAALFALGVAAASCAHTLGENAIALRVECNVPDATVWVDDVLVGRASDWKSDGHHIKAGFHRIEIRHPNYYSFFQEVEMAGGSQVVVNAKLRELIE
jgi:hypothetical protein